MDLIITIPPVVTKDLPISPRFTPYDFLSRCKFRTLTTRQPMVEFYLLTFPRFPLRKKEHKFYFGKNRTHDFRTSRCAGYLLDHSGDECPEKDKRTLFLSSFAPENVVSRDRFSGPVPRQSSAHSPHSRLNLVLTRGVPPHTARLFWYVEQTALAEQNDVLA